MTTEGASDGRGEVGLSEVLAILRVHSIGAFNGSQSACSHCREWMTHDEYREHLAALLADRTADLRAERDQLRADVVAVLPAECRVTRHAEMVCTDMIGGGFENGAKWTEEMCCVPCRVRAALASTDRHDGVRGGGTDG